VLKYVSKVGFIDLQHFPTNTTL